MRVLISTIGSRGEVQPVVAAARELAVRGHEVIVVAPPDFQEWAEAAGVTYRAVGPRLRGTATRKSSGVPSEEQRRQMIEATVSTQFDALTAAGDCDVVVGGGALAVAAASVAEYRDARYVYAAFAPITLPSTRHAPPVFRLPGQRPADQPADPAALWEQDSQRWNLLWRGALSDSRAALGLEPITDVRSHLFTDHPLLAADPILAPWPEPEDGRVCQTGAWLFTDERALPADVERFLDAGEPPVLVGFGSMPAPGGAVPAVAAAARALGRRLIVAGGWAELTAPGPDALVLGEVDLRQVFARVAAVVHHGGAGTTTTAAVAGAPQIVLPQIFDQFYFARRVEALGIGRLYSGAPDAESMTLALRHALDLGTVSRASEVADVVRVDGVRVAADIIESGD